LAGSATNPCLIAQFTNPRIFRTSNNLLGIISRFCVIWRGAFTSDASRSTGFVNTAGPLHAEQVIK